MIRAAAAQLQTILGVEPNTTSHTEKIVSIVGAFAGIFMVMVISSAVLGHVGAALMVASMGASTVLLFAVPHGALSQPWPMVGGNVISAIVGVTVYKFVPDVPIAAPLAVALAIGAMHYLRCIHPPGGATALVAVIGGTGVHALGYRYVVTPVSLNVAVLLGTAVLFNSAFPWRRYPTSLNSRHTPAEEESAATEPSEFTISHADLEFAMQQMDLVVDVTEDDLERICVLARHHAAENGGASPQIAPGRYYCNGQYSGQWAVREVLAIDAAVHGPAALVDYRVVAGEGRRRRGTCTRGEFSRWARYEVMRNENSWQRVTAAAASQVADLKYG